MRRLSCPPVAAAATALVLAGMACLALGAMTGVARADDRLAAIKQAGLLRVCIWPSYYAVSFRNPRDGKLSGIDIDMARAFAEDLGVGISYIDSSFATFGDDLDAGRCDVAMFGIGVTPARQELVDFSVPHLRSGMYAVTKKGNKMVTTWDDLDKPGHVVAVQSGTIMEPFMRAYLKQADLLVVAPPATREDELQAGRADAFISDYPYTQRMRFQHDWAEIIAPPNPTGVTDYAYAVKKGQPGWLARVNEFVEAVKHDGRLAQSAERHGLAPILIKD